jgi:hypothetical protein
MSIEPNQDYFSFKVGQEGPLDKKIKDLIFRATTFIVYIDEDNTIQWSTREYGEFHDDFGDIQNKISYWESVSNKLFKKKESYDYKCLLAEAYARILDDKNVKMANQIIDRTVNRIQKQGQEILKQNYVLTSFFCTLFVILILILIVIFYPQVLTVINQDVYEILMTTLFGGIGAFVFTVIRLRKYTPEIVISKNVHRIDGALRIFFGLVSGLIIAIGIKSNIFFGFLDGKEGISIYVKAFLGIVGGASEVLIPNLIKQIEDKSANGTK